MNSSSGQWTIAHESILKEWKAKAFAYLWLQTNSCYLYITIYNFLSYVVIILSSFAAATMFSITDTSPSISTNCSYVSLGIPIIIIQYIIGTVSLLAAILTSISRQLRPGEMYQQHASMAKRYNNLIRSIDVCLSLTKCLRPDPTNFIDKIGTELENLADNQIEAPLIIIRKFEKNYGPIDRILYGEDVVELWKIRYNTNKMERIIMRKTEKEVKEERDDKDEKNKKDREREKDKDKDTDKERERERGEKERERTSSIDIDVYKSKLYNRYNSNKLNELENIVIVKPDNDSKENNLNINIDYERNIILGHENTTPKFIKNNLDGLYNINEPFKTSSIMKTNWK